jgi:hypothetical protein
VINLLLIRRDAATNGDLFIDRDFQAVTREDPDHGLDAGMPLEEIRAAKPCAIPAGAYQVFVWRRDEIDTLGLADVPGFVGVGFEEAGDEELGGSIAVGHEPQDLVALRLKIAPRIRAGEPCWLTIDRETTLAR